MNPGFSFRPGPTGNKITDDALRIAFDYIYQLRNTTDTHTTTETVKQITQSTITTVLASNPPPVAPPPIQFGPYEIRPPVVSPGTFWVETERQTIAGRAPLPIYLFNGSVWEFVSGIFYRTMAQVSALAATFTANDVGAEIITSDGYSYVWNGTSLDILTVTYVLVESALPTVALLANGSSLKTRMGQIYIAGTAYSFVSQNLYWDGSNWMCDDVSKIGSVLFFFPTSWQFYSCGPASNPQSLVNSINIGFNARIGVGGNVAPAYDIDAAGDINIANGHFYRVNGVPGETTSVIFTFLDSITVAPQVYSVSGGGGGTVTVPVVTAQHQTTVTLNFTGGILTSHSVV